MQRSAELRFDVTSAISQGCREHQEDAVLVDFPLGSEIGFAVLADGMGGHAAGDIASKIVVTEVFSELKLRSGNRADFEGDLTETLQAAAAAANECVAAYATHFPEAQGMGTTLVAPVLVENRLYWVSVGDSPLYLYRDGTLRQLNEDHSMAPQIDHLVSTGKITEDAGQNHPDRHCLTSVLIGQQIPRVDCPKEPLTLLPDDIVIVASDGLQFLEDYEIANLLEECRDKSSAEISTALLKSLEMLADPGQDNVAFCVIRAAAIAAAACAQPTPQIVQGASSRKPHPRKEAEYHVGTISDANMSLTYCLSRTRRRSA